MAVSPEMIAQTIHSWKTGYPLGYPMTEPEFEVLTEFADYLCKLRAREDYEEDGVIERMYKTACVLIEQYEDEHMIGWLAS